MNKSIKKILVTGASLLMLASAGAGISNINANASSGYYYLKRNYYSFPKGLRLHSPQTDTEDHAEEFFRYGNNGDGVFIPWRDVGYHRNVHHAHYYHPIRHHYHKHAKKHYRRMAKKAKPRKARKHHYTKHIRKATTKVTRSRKSHARKQHPYLRLKRINRKTNKGNKAYKYGYYLGSYFNASNRGEDYIGNKIYKNMSYQPSLNKTAFFKGYMAAAAPKSAFGNDKYGRNEVKNAINAWKHNLANQNNGMFQQGVKDELKMAIDQKSLNIPDSLKNNSDYRDGFKTTIIYLDGDTYNANHVLNNSLKYSDAI